jgi:hypothetical protein
LRAVQQKGWTLAVVEAGLRGDLARRLSMVKTGFQGGEILPHPLPQDELRDETEAFRNARQAEVGLGVAIYPGPEKQDVYLVLITPSGMQEFSRPYGGPSENAPRWAFHHSLDLIRNL